MRALFLSLLIGGTLAVTPPGYAYEGCYYYPGGEQPLDFIAGVSKTGMTLEKCAISCRDYPLFGVQSGSSCSCGRDLFNGAEERPDDACNLPCTGNDRFGNDEICGGDDPLSVYRQVNPGAIPAIPSVVSYTSLGCYLEPIGSGILDDTFLSPPASTVQACEAVCAGFRFFALRDTFTCACGDTMNVNSRIAADASCSTACLGNPSQQCGSGTRFNNVYASAALASCANLNTPLRVRNPGFENGVAYWTTTSTAPDLIQWQSISLSGIGGSGKRMARITSRQSGARLTLSQSVPVCPGTGYIFSYFARALPSSPDWQIGTRVNGGAATITDVNGFETRKSVYVTSSEPEAQIEIFASSSTAGSLATVYLDDVELRPATVNDASLFPPI